MAESRDKWSPPKIVIDKRSSIEIKTDEESGQSGKDAFFLPENFPQYVRVTNLLTSLCLMLINYDPHSIYKGTNKVSHLAKYRLYLSDELRIDDCKNDLKQKANIAKFIILIYLVTKYIVICIIQIIRYSISQDNLNALENTNQTLKFLDYLGSLIGNPLSALTGISLMIYSGFIVGFIYSFGFLPYYFTYNPVDAISLRFMLDAQREIKRVDMLIKQKLDDFASFINMQRYPLRDDYLIIYDERYFSDYQQNSNYHKNNKLNIHQKDENENHLMFLNQQMNILNEERSRIWKMRPEYYSSETFKQLETNVFRSQINSVAIGIIILCILPESLLNRATHGKCQLIYSREICSINDVFNWRDLLAFAELLFGIICLGIIIVFEIITIISNNLCQLRTANNMKEDLTDYLSTIRKLNIMKEEKRVLNYPNIKMSIRNNKYHSSNQYADHLEKQLMGKMLRYLIKLSLTEVDVRLNSVYMSQILESFLITLAMLLLSSLFADRLSGLDMRSFRTTVITGTILGLNVILFACAFSYAKVIDTEKIGWSILAQNCIRANHQSVEYDSYNYDTFIMSWRKLIISKGLSDTRNAVRVFGLDINFKRILELNFLVISLISLLKTY